MKRLTASDARRNWFRILDEVAAGEVVSIERGGRTILIQRAPPERTTPEVPDYSGILEAPDVGDVHRWGWDWTEEGDIHLVPGEESEDE